VGVRNLLPRGDLDQCGAGLPSRRQTAGPLRGPRATGSRHRHAQHQSGPLPGPRPDPRSSPGSTLVRRYVEECFSSQRVAVGQQHARAPITRRHRNSTPGPARKLANAAHGVATVDPRSRVDATRQNGPAAPPANHRRAAAKRLWFAWATHDHQLLDAVRSVQGVGHIVPLSRLRLASPVVLGWVCRPRWWAPRTGRVGADRRPSSTRHPRTRGRSG